MGRRPRGPLEGWEPTTARQKGILADLIARYEQHRDEDALPRGGRGMFYDLRPDGMGNGVTYRRPTSQDPKTEMVMVEGKKKRTRLWPEMHAAPEDVQEVLVLARRAGIIDESWVADTRAPEGIG